MTFQNVAANRQVADSGLSLSSRTRWSCRSRIFFAHGREQVLHSAARLLGQPLQAIIASSYVRAQQTGALQSCACRVEGR